MYEALVARVRYHIQKANFMGLKDAESTLLLEEAADAIESLEAALILMVLQYCTDEDGTLWHQFMCAGEGAFDALGITLKTNPQVLWDRLEKIEKSKGGKRSPKEDEA